MARKATKARAAETRELTITRLIEVPIQVTIPIACPKCGADFTENNTLVEDQWGAGGQRCYLPLKAPTGPDDPTLADYGEQEDIFDGNIAVGYRCAECGHVLANTEPTRTLTPEVIRGLRFALANVIESDVSIDQAGAVDMARAFVEDLGVIRFARVPRG